MKKRKSYKQWLALILTIVLLVGEGSQAMAVSVSNNATINSVSENRMLFEEVEKDTSDNGSIAADTEEVFSEDGGMLGAIGQETLSDNELTEEETQEIVSDNELTEKETEESVSNNELTEKEIEESISDNELTEEETEESISDNDMEEAVSANDIAKESKGVFPGLGDEYTFSASEMKSKNSLHRYANKISGMKEGKDYVAGEILVSADSEEEAMNYAKAFGGTLKRYFTGVAVITLGTDEEDRAVTVREAVAASADPDIKLPAAWPNYYYEAYGDVHVYNDPFLLEDRDYQWHHSMIGSWKAWEAGYTGSGVKVAVLDSGAPISNEGVAIHADLPITAINANNGLGIIDGDSHGTHVAGIIGADGNNGIGGSGVAPDAQLYSIKVLDDNGAGTSDTILAGIQAAITADVDIINMSLGGSWYSDFEAKAVKDAYEAGIAVFCAAGNDAAGAVCYPAGYNGAIAVAALDTNSHQASFSNYGSHIRYSAPGVDIVSTGIASDPYAFVIDNQYYSYMSGTSQATPVVTGIAAVLWNVVGGEGTDKVDNLLALMDKSCEKITGSGLGKGCVSLVKALQLDSLSSAPNAPVFSKKKGIYYSESIDVDIDAGVGSTVYYTTNGKNITYKNGKISDGAILYTEGIPVTLSGKNSVTLKAIAINDYNQLASKVTSVTYTLKPCASNVNIYSATGNNVVAQGKSLQLKADLLPAYTTDKKLSWTVLNGDTDITVNASNGKVTAKKDADTNRTYWVRATAKAADGTFTGAYMDYEIKVVAVTNPITKIVATPKSVTMKSTDRAEVQIAVTKKDKSMGTAEEITWSSNDSSVVQVSQVLGNTVVLQGVKAGKTKINGIANDGSGKKLSFNVTVTQAAENITITGYNTVAAGKSITLKATVGPSNVTNKKVNWFIESDTTGGLVSVHKTSGKVTAKTGANGSCSVRAEAADGSGVWASYSITVTPGKMSKLLLQKSSVSLFRVANNFGTPTEAYIGVDAIGDNIDSWMVQSSNEDIVTAVKDGNQVRVTAAGKATGTATITVMSTDGSNLKKTCKVTVNNPITNLTLAPEKGRSSYIAYGKKLKLTPTFETAYGPVSSSAKKLKWESSDTSVVKVDQSGNVSVVDPWGYSARITARTTDGSNLMASYIVRTCGAMTKLELGYTDYFGNWRTLSGTTWIPKGEGLGYYIGGTLKGSYIASLDLDVKVDKPGLSVQYDSDGYNQILGFIGNKPGNYKVTITCKDGSSAKASYNFRVY